VKRAIYQTPASLFYQSVGIRRRHTLVGRPQVLRREFRD
jgi:hypothetical protein